MRLGLEAGPDTHKLAVELGIRGVPIDGGALVKEGVDASLVALREHGLVPCQIGAFGYNPLSPDAAAVKEQSELLRALIPLAAGTGCRYITISPASYAASPFSAYDVRNFTDAAITDLAEALKPMVELAERHHAVLTIEAYLKGVIRSAESFNVLHALVGSDHLRCNVDPSSLYAAALDFFSPMPLVERTIDGLAGHIGLVHLKEIGVQDGFHIQMGLTPMSDGHTDWAALLKRVAPHTPDDAWVIVEHCLSADEARASVATIRQAAQSAGVILE